MLIFSQNKKALYNLSAIKGLYIKSTFRSNDLNDRMWRIIADVTGHDNNEKILGEYETEQEAKTVLIKIAEYATWKNVYEM